jgi:hypothetical protein
MRVSREEPVTIRCRYFVEAYRQDKSLNIQVDGDVIGHDNVSATLDGTSVDGLAVEYPIPPEITSGKDNIRVVIRLANGIRMTELRVLNLSR